MCSELHAVIHCHTESYFLRSEVITVVSTKDFVSCFRAEEIPPKEITNDLLDDTVSVSEANNFHT
jgi:hypothetical protein